MGKKTRRPANDRSLKKYKSENTWIKNKIYKLEKYVKANPNDKQAEAKLGQLERGEGKYNRNNVPKGHSWKPQDILYAEMCASIKGKVQHHLEFGANIDKTPSRPDWVKVLEPLLNKPTVRVKRRGYRRVKD